MSQEQSTIDHLGFCNAWHASKGKPFVAWDEEAARQAHEQGSPYGVLFYAEGHLPLATAEIRGGAGDRFVDVSFLRADGQLEFVYYYSSVDVEERLFLRCAMCFGGERNLKDLTSHTWRLRHEFVPDGTATTFFFEEGSGTTNTPWKFDPTRQFIDFPTFGDFERLAALKFGQDWAPEDRHGLGK